MSLYLLLGIILHAEKCWKLGFIHVSHSPFICLIDEMVEVTDFGLAKKTYETRFGQTFFSRNCLGILHS